MFCLFCVLVVFCFLECPQRESLRAEPASAKYNIMGDYEERAVTHEQARRLLFDELQESVQDHQRLRRAVHDAVPDTVDMCSVRGYWTFQHAPFRQEVLRRLDEAENREGRESPDQE